MTRPVLRRLFGSFCMLWFAISIAQPALLHACPMHDTATATAAESAPSAAHHGHGASDLSARSGQNVDSSAPSESHQGACTCLGQCAAAASLGLLTPRIALVELAVVATQDAGLPEHAYIPVARALLLPFANGPPALPPSQRV